MEYLTVAPGDLGVQRGIVRWSLALHSPSFNVVVSPDKLPATPEEQEKTSAPPKDTASQSQDPDVVPSLGGYTDVESSVAPAPAVVEVSAAETEAPPDALPVPFTPSIDKTLNMKVTKNGAPVRPPAPLPVGMTIAMLKGRLDPKKKVKWVCVVLISCTH